MVSVLSLRGKKDWILEKRSVGLNAGWAATLRGSLERRESRDEGGLRRNVLCDGADRGDRDGEVDGGGQDEDHWEEKRGQQEDVRKWDERSSRRDPPLKKNELSV